MHRRHPDRLRAARAWLLPLLVLGCSDDADHDGQGAADAGGATEDTAGATAEVGCAPLCDLGHGDLGHGGPDPDAGPSRDLGRGGGDAGDMGLADAGRALDAGVGQDLDAGVVADAADAQVPPADAGAPDLGTVGDRDTDPGDVTPPADVGPPLPDSGSSELEWGRGPHAVRGAAYFFTMERPPTLEQVHDVAAAEVFVVEAPQLRARLSPADGHAFCIPGIPEGARVTLALVAPGYFPVLTATLPVAGGDLDGVNFQVVDRSLVALGAALLGVDAEDEGQCQMAITVTAPGGDSIWAAGEPGATVTLEPSVPPEQGPVYFNTLVLPDTSLAATTTDGGVLVAGARPGVYRWQGHKEGLRFEELTLRCVGGWITVAAPPRSMNGVVVVPGGGE
ncbi:MAG: hypothetical protein RBU45_25855 [Myxococcota bacterium]|nr:hypothetical protein [Myxococcota bacterium]